MSDELGNTWTTERSQEWPPRPAESDPGGAHFMRFLGLQFLLTALGLFFIPALIMLAVILSKTGYRKRDVLLMMIPIYGNVVNIRAVWRVTSRTVYWEPRHDRPSEPFDNGGKGPAIAGWILGPVALVGMIVLAVVAGTGGWTSFDKSDFRRGLEQEGVSSTEAECVTEFFVQRYPDGPSSIPDDEDDPTFRSTAQEAFAACPD